MVLSVPGAMLALYLTGSALSMPSMIGLIMPMGIATKNSILLVVPVVYSSVDDAVQWMRRRIRSSRWNAGLSTV